MKIVIIGSGKVGYRLAQQLSTEEHDITVVDNDDAALSHADDTLDVMCIKGNGASVKTMKEAGVNEADLLIAVTDGDELNMICCVIGKKLGARHTVARIRNTDYSNEYSMLKEELELNMVINPELETAAEITQMLQLPYADHIESFANNALEMVGFRILEDDPIVNIKLTDLTKQLPSKILFCALMRDDEVIIPKGEFSLSVDDIVYVIGEKSSIYKFFKYIGRNSQKAKNVTIIGGSRIAIYLTWMLNEIGMNVKIIEIDKERCLLLNDVLEDTLIINGDGTDQEVLDNENIHNADAFIALTNRDEENLISSIYALQCEVPNIILKINRLNYVPIVKQLGLDKTISTKYTTANNILRYVRALDNSQGSQIEKLYRIMDDNVEVAEFIANSSTYNLGVKFKEKKVKDDILIAAIVRDKKIIVPFGNDFFKENDKVIVVSKKNYISDLNDIYD